MNSKSRTSSKSHNTGHGVTGDKVASAVNYVRPIIAAVIPLVLFGVVYAYSSFVSSLPEIQRQEFIQEQATGKYEIEVTLTFTAQPDWGDYEQRSFYILASKRAGNEDDRTIASSKKPIPPGEPLLFSVAGNVVKGTNQFDVFAGVGDEELSPDETDAFGQYEESNTKSFSQQRAMRIRILKDGEPQFETTLWSQPGQPIRESITLVVKEEDNQHDH